MLEPQIHLVLDRMSNDQFDDLEILDQYIEDAGEALKEVLRHQMTPNSGEFGLRMSNVGKHLCQLQMAASGAVPSKKPYSFKMQMMIGDCVEILTDFVLKVAGANITGGKDKVSLDVEGTTIKGTDDIEIDGKVFDVKSASPWAFQNKWSQGYEYLKNNDDFGYVGQLIGYAKAKGKPPGGWIVVCKSTGAVRVIECDPSDDEVQAVTEMIEKNVTAIKTNAPFKRCFEPIEDKWRGKPTGDKRLCKTCEFCNYLGTCWPDAEFLAHPKSEAKNPPHYWFVKDD